MAQSEYTQTYTAYSGSDIIVTFKEKVIGELQAITYSVTREKAPIYTMGDPNPRSFSRGKRGIAGSLVFQVFDRDALHMMKQEENVYSHGTNSTGQSAQPVHDSRIAGGDVGQQWASPRKAHYSDEIPPFDVTISFLNEYGQSARMVIQHVEILNEGMGMSIDDISTEKACTFIARSVEEMEPGPGQGRYSW